MNKTPTIWASRIAELQSLDMTYADIAAKTGLSPGAVGDLATGRSKSPRGEAALALHDLHATETKKAAKRERSKAA